jgi:hypothetical protein
MPIPTNLSIFNQIYQLHFTYQHVTIIGYQTEYRLKLSPNMIFTYSLRIRFLKRQNEVCNISMPCDVIRVSI